LRFNGSVTPIAVRQVAFGQRHAALPHHRRWLIIFIKPTGQHFFCKISGGVANESAYSSILTSNNQKFSTTPMNRSFHPLLALAATSYFALVQAQSGWQTVDTLTPAAGRDIVADNAGNFLSLSLDYTTTNAITVVSRSVDAGVTWQTVGTIAGYALDLTAAPDGALFAAGNRSTTVSGRAFVWQSLDHGSTWTVSDPWAGQSTTFLSLDVAAGNSTAVYLCGYIPGGNGWVVRKGERTTGGISWATVDNVPGNQPDSICVRPAAIPGQSDEVLVSGRISGLWTVRRSVNGGATWATVDSYSTGTQPTSMGVATGPNNSIYVVGRVATTVTNQTVVGKKVVISTTTQYGWLVRRSTNAGANWTNVDYFANGWPGNGNIQVDAFGRVLVVGFNMATPYTWLVRGSIDGGTTWTTTDLFTPAGATSSQAYGIAGDGSGNVCVVGESLVGGTKVASVRRLAAPLP